jgi:hypothetical protein
VTVEAANRVIRHRARRDDELPVRRLDEQQFPSGLGERLQSVRGMGYKLQRADAPSDVAA